MKYDLVFEGGGAKGIVFVGALEVLERREGYVFGRLLGTSAGAITATFVAAGYTAAEMQAKMSATQNGRSIFADFMETPTSIDDNVIQSGVVRTLLSGVTQSYLPSFLQSRFDESVLRRLAAHNSLRQLLLFAEYGGWYSANNFLNWLRKELNSGSYQGQPRNFAEMTLDDFFEATQVELSLVAANITRQKLMVLNHTTAPDLPLVWAVRMSMSLPFVWPEVVWLKEWGAYRGNEATGDVIVDGGLLSNFPLELFVSSDPRITSVVGPKESDAILGLLIDESLPAPGAQPAQTSRFAGRLSELHTTRRLLNLIDTVTSARDKMVIDAFEELVVRLPAQGYGTTEFDMDEERRELLIAAGRTAMIDHLDRHPPDLAKAASFEMFDALAAEEEQAQQTADKIALRILDQ
jgi:NTE family protein